MYSPVTALIFLACCLAFASGAVSSTPLFDMEEIHDTSSLQVEVLQEWHRVEGPVPTRQKLVTISVGELWKGQFYRVPVRFIVPADRKAKGFHLTGGNQVEQLKEDAKIRGVDLELIKGGVGLVRTVVQTPTQMGQRKLGQEMENRFAQTLNPRYSVQFWGWPATLMRATTAAYSEGDFFEPGKIALSGGSKNGASPSVSIIHDTRLTALHSSVAPIWDSPLRMCDLEAWKELDKDDAEYVSSKNLNTQQTDRILKHAFRGGYFGPCYNSDAMAEGHSWGTLQAFAKEMADHVFIARRLEELRKRGVDLLFHPGTHDFVCYDLAWGGIHHPDIPLYLKVNTGHGKGKGHSQSEKNEANKAAFLLNHFFEGVDSLLPSPSITTARDGQSLVVEVSFPPGLTAESGRIWWMYDRADDGTGCYLEEMFSEDQWMDMNYNSERAVWIAHIDLDEDARRIDIITNHLKTVQYENRTYPTYVSSPYTRLKLSTEANTK